MAKRRSDSAGSNSRESAWNSISMMRNRPSVAAEASSSAWYSAPSMSIFTTFGTSPWRSQ